MRDLRRSKLRVWAGLHTWSSLICTLFLFVVCLTGLPLLFHDEIDDWLDPPVYASLPADTPRISLDRLVAHGRAIYPRDVVLTVFVDDDEPQVILRMASSFGAADADPDAAHVIRFDARTGNVLGAARQTAGQKRSIIDTILRLHGELFAGLPGALFMGVMALLFVVAIVSGVALYGPFTRKLDFGAVRRERARRVRWLDLHNLLGVTTLAWTLVVGTTGVMNEMTKPLFGLWQMTDVAAVVAPWRGKAPPRQAELSSVQAAFDTTQHALPGMVVTSAVFPGGQFGSPHHYLLFAKGRTPLTGRLFSPVLVDARTGHLAAVVRMPWYLRALEVSRPLHFGDYGGMPLKILWALLDLVAMIVLGSGLYLWVARPRRGKASAAGQMRCGTSLPAEMGR